MKNENLGYLIRQFDLAWKLTWIHLEGISTEECLWRPAQKGMHVYLTAAQDWEAAWPDHEGYDIGPSSIAWLTWHIGFWWSMVINHSFGDATLIREDIKWPGNADATRTWIKQLQVEWRQRVISLTDDDLSSAHKTRWPYQNRPFGDIVAWVNFELIKNCAEIGYARFLYSAHSN